MIELIRARDDIKQRVMYFICIIWSLFEDHDLYTSIADNMAIWDERSINIKPDKKVMWEIILPAKNKTL